MKLWDTEENTHAYAGDRVVDGASNGRATPCICGSATTGSSDVWLGVVTRAMCPNKKGGDNIEELDADALGRGRGMDCVVLLL